MKRNILITSLVALGAILLPLNTESKTDKSNEPVVLSSENVIMLNSEVNGESTALVISKAKELDIAMSKKIKSRLGLSDKKPIYLFLNTPGGSIQSGLEMVEALKGLGRQVNTITLFAASMGFQIAQNLDERYILKNGVLMSHRARGQFEGEFGGTSPSQMDSRYHLWLERMNEMDEQTVKRTNGKQTLESYKKAYSPELWLTGNESVAQGYADKVISVKCDSSLDGVTTKETSYMGLPVQYDLDNCPINTAPMNVRMKITTTERINIDGNTQAKTALMEVNKFMLTGGGFGLSCLNSNAPLCASDPYLTPERIAEIKAKFMDQFTNKKDKIVPMYW